MIFPFLSYLLFRVMLMEECNDFEKYIFGLLFFFLLIFSNFYFVVYHTEKNYKHEDNSEGRFKFLAPTLGIFFFYH